MNTNTARILLKSLLSRLREDARQEIKRFAGLVSEEECEALDFLLRDAKTESDAIAVASFEAAAGGSQPAEHSPLKVDQTFVAEAILPEIATQPSNAKNSAQPVLTDSPGERALTTSAVMGRVGSSAGVCEEAFKRTTPGDPNVLLCLDFGTAKSKAFASSLDGDPLELGIGISWRDANGNLRERDDDVDGKVYGVTSSVWIDEAGLMFVGSEAFRRGQSADADRPRRRLDSLKQNLILAVPGEALGTDLLKKDENPTDVTLTYGDAITYYLAYLTDLAVSELEERHGKSRYVKRRFTLPCWPYDQRKQASRFIYDRLACAQVLADTFQGRWRQGVHVKEVKETIRSILPRVNELKYLLDAQPTSPDNSAAHWGGLLEPLAAGSARIWAEKPKREIMIVLDVGAGTCDLSLFWVDQNFLGKGERAFPVVPSGIAISKAGDTLDALLVKELLDRAHLGQDYGYLRQVSSRLFLSGVRRLKERLFTTGALQHRIVDTDVSITLEEFLKSEGVVKFTTELEGAVQGFLDRVDKSWVTPLESAKLVLTGGGCELPMVTDLKKKGWLFNGQTLHFGLAKSVPDEVRDTFSADLIREYPSLAVALGGSLPTILREDSTLGEWPGKTPPPGPLTRYQTTGPV